MENVKNGSIGIGMRSMTRDFGDELVVKIAPDSSASKGTASRLGLGKNPSSRTAMVATSSETQGAPVSQDRSGNPADIGTKDLAEKDMKRIMINLGFREKTGRHLKTLCTAVGAGSPARPKMEKAREAADQSLNVFEA